MPTLYFALLAALGGLDAVGSAAAVTSGSGTGVGVCGELGLPTDPESPTASGMPPTESLLSDLPRENRAFMRANTPPPPCSAAAGSELRRVLSCVRDSPSALPVTVAALGSLLSVLFSRLRAGLAFDTDPLAWELLLDVEVSENTPLKKFLAPLAAFFRALFCLMAAWSVAEISDPAADVVVSLETSNADTSAGCESGWVSAMAAVPA
jgi:hypothetical protein